MMKMNLKLFYRFQLINLFNCSALFSFQLEWQMRNKRLNTSRRITRNDSSVTLVKPSSIAVKVSLLSLTLYFDPVYGESEEATGYLYLN